MGSGDRPSVLCPIYWEPPPLLGASTVADSDHPKSHLPPGLSSCAGTPEAPGLCQRPKLLQLVKTVVKQVVKTPKTPSLIQKVENQLM